MNLDRMPSGGKPRLAIMAFVCALIGVLGSIIAGWMAYSSGRHAVLDFVARENLSLAQSIVNQSELVSSPRSKGTAGWQRVKEIWDTTQPHFEGTFICVIGPEGKIDYHSIKPESVGKDVSEVVVTPSDSYPKMVKDLLNAKQDLATENVNFRGIPQLAGYAYMPSQGSLVVVHVPTSLLNGEIREATLPWIFAFGIFGGLFIPVAFFLCSASLNRFYDEKSIRESELQFRTIFDQAGIGVARIDSKTGKFLQINQRYCQILGRSAEELIGQTFEFVSHPGELEENLRLLQRLVAGDLHEYEMEKRYIHKEGHDVWVTLNVTPMWNAGEAPTTHIAVVQEITLRKKAEEALRIRDHAFASSSNGIVISDARDDDHPIIYCNPAFEKLTGYTQSEVLGRNCRFLQGDDRDQSARGAISSALSNGEEVSAQLRNYRKDGSMFWTELRISPVYDDLGELTHFIGFQNDVTDRVQAELSLRESELRFRNLCSNAPVGIFIDGPDGECTYVNEKFSEIVGLGSSDAIGEGWRNAIHPEDRQRVIDAWNQAQKNCEDYSIEFRMCWNDGPVSWVHANSTSNQVVSGSTRGRIGILTDITERKRFEQSRREYDQRFAAIFNSTFQFIGLLSPDGILLEANETALKFADLDAVDVLHKPFWTAHWWVGDDARIEKLKDAISRAAAGEFVRYTVEINGANSVETIDFSIKPVFDDDGDVKLLVPEGRIISEQKRVEDSLRTLVKISSYDQGVSFLRTCATELADVIKADRIIIGELTNPESGLIETKTVFNDGQLDPNFSFRITDSPSEFVPEKKLRTIPAGLMKQFPDLEMLRGHEFEAYVGAPLFNATGRPIGLVAALFRNPLGRIEFTESIMTIFSARIANELERSHSEQDLKTYAERLELAKSVNNDGMYDWNLESGKFFIDPTNYTMAGYEPDEFPPEYGEWIARVHPEDIPRIRKALKWLSTGKLTVYEAEFRFKHKSEFWMWIRMRVKTVDHDANGQPRRIVGIHSDITEQKRAEEILIESEQRLVDAQRIAKMGDCTWIPANNQIIFSRGMYELLGYQPTDDLDLPAIQQAIHHPDDFERVMHWVEEHLQSGATKLTANEYRLIRKDNSVIYVHVDGVIDRSDDESPKLFATVHDITERKAAEFALRNSEERYRTLVELAPVCIHEIDSEGRLISINDAGVQMMGATDVTELIGMDYLDAVSESDLTRVTELLAGAYAGNAGNFEFESRSGRIFDSCFVPLQGPGGNVYRIIGITQDITERKQAEQQLQITQFSVDSSSTLIFWIREDSSFSYINDAVTERFGYSRDELLTMSVKDIDPDYPPSVWQEFWQMMQSEKSATLETKIRCKDGSVVPVEISTSLCEIESNEFVFAFVTDITSRKESEKMTRESEARFRAIVEHSYDVINLFSESGELLYVSPSVQRVLGFDSEELTTFHPFDCLHPEDVEQAKNEFERFVATPGCTNHFLQRLRHKTGKYRTVEVTGTNLLDEPGINAIVWIFRDITDKTFAEKQLRERESQLAHVSRLSTMGEMAAGIAHEIKQPLHAVSNFATAASIALSDIEVEKEIVDDLIEWNQGIGKASQRASEIVRRLRSFARKSAKTRTAVNVSELILEAIDLMAFEARRNKIDVEFRSTGPVPELFCDNIQVQQVIVNLLQNSFDAFATTSTSDRRVLVSARTQPGSLEIEVADNGPGIETKIQGQIFDAFFTSKNNGMGMGLAISRTIIEDHNGRLWATINEMGGATFKFTLPLVSESLANLSGVE